MQGLINFTKRYKGSSLLQIPINNPSQFAKTNIKESSQPHFDLASAVPFDLKNLRINPIHIVFLAVLKRFPAA